LRHRLGDLAERAQRQAVGIIEPLLVTPNDHGTYTVIAGRRLAATRLPPAFRNCRASCGRSLSRGGRTGAHRNSQRNDLSPVEEAEGYYQLFEAGRTVADMSERSGSQRSISARLAAPAPKKRRARAQQDQPQRRRGAQTARQHPT
jgi:ParB-like chromosome segregation protein Spo0J